MTLPADILLNFVFETKTSYSSLSVESVLNYDNIQFSYKSLFMEMRENDITITVADSLLQQHLLK